MLALILAIISSVLVDRMWAYTRRDPAFVTVAGPLGWCFGALPAFALIVTAAPDFPVASALTAAACLALNRRSIRFALVMIANADLCAPLDPSWFGLEGAEPQPEPEIDPDELVGGNNRRHSVHTGTLPRQGETLCTNCRYMQAAGSWWCVSQSAADLRGTLAITANITNCPSWRPMRSRAELRRDFPRAAYVVETGD